MKLNELSLLDGAREQLEGNAADGDHSRRGGQRLLPALWKGRAGKEGKLL
jgi:hypothetical protein